MSTERRPPFDTPPPRPAPPPPALQVDCANKPGDSLLAELCGRGSREGLLHWVGEGSVLLKNVHKVTRAPPDRPPGCGGSKAGQR
jgi:hypothetical protein